MLISKKRILFLAISFFVVFGGFSFFLSQEKTPAPILSYDLSSSELGIAASSPLGESGGLVVPASCPSDPHPSDIGGGWRDAGCPAGYTGSDMWYDNYVCGIYTDSTHGTDSCTASCTNDTTTHDCSDQNGYDEEQDCNVSNWAGTFTTTYCGSTFVSSTWNCTGGNCDCTEIVGDPQSCWAAAGQFGIPATDTDGTASWTYNSCTNAITYTGGCSNPCVSNQGSDCTGPTSSSNACGQTSAGGAGSIQCDGSCSGATGSTPANPAGYGNACTGATSAANACDQTSAGGAGSIQCDGSCNGATGSTPDNPWWYDSACYAWNSCGTDYNSGVYDCDGSCSAGAPADPWYYGVGCTSAANACGGTNNGTLDCGGTCSASTPANPTYYGTTCTSVANTCGQTSAGTNNCSNVCSATTPANPTYYGTTCTSAANTCGGTASGTKNCSNTCTASTPANPWYYGVGCTSSANACAQVNTGTYDCSYICSAVTPSNSTCTDPALSFSASLTTVAPNGTSTLSWTPTNAVSCTASNGWSGSVASSGSNTSPQTIPSTKTFSLECKNAANVSTGVRSVTVTVPASPTLSFSASPTTVAPNGTSTLSWTPTNAVSCTASNGWSGSVASSGSNTSPQTIPSTKTFSLECWNSVGVSSGVQSVTVTVTAAPGAPTLSFSASPTSVSASNPSTLTWTVGGTADSCFASNGWSGWKAFSGTNNFVVTPATTATYTLECWNAGVSSGQKSATVTVTAAPVAPTLSFSASPTVALSSVGTSTLSWSATNATSCWASNDWTGWQALPGGTSPQTILSTKTFTLECWNSVGVSTGPQSVTVNFYTCSGSFPTHATSYGGDAADLAVPASYSYAANDTSAKCEFKCESSSYTWNSTTKVCVLNCSSNCSATASSHCSGSPYPTTDSCNNAEICTGTKSCNVGNFNWVEVAP